MSEQGPGAGVGHILDIPVSLLVIVRTSLILIFLAGEAYIRGVHGMLTITRFTVGWWIFPECEKGEIPGMPKSLKRH